MTTYFTIGDFILLIPMALAGALFLGAVPCATQFRHNLLRVLGVILGVGVAHGEALDQRRQAFNEQYRDADAENDAEYAQQVVAELGGARYRAEK